MKEFKSIIKGSTPVLVAFYANWHTPSRASLTILNELPVTFGSSLQVLKIDVDKHIDITNKYKIIGVPTYILFLEGNILWRTTGELSQEELLTTITPVLAEIKE